MYLLVVYFSSFHTRPIFHYISMYCTGSTHQWTPPRNSGGIPQVSTRFSLSMEMSRLTRDGTAEPISREQILRRERGQGRNHFPFSADHEQDWQPYPVVPYSYCMCDYPYTHTYIARVRIHQVRLLILLAVNSTGKMNICLSLFAPENLVSRNGFDRPVLRQPAHLHTQAECGAYLRDSSRVPRRRPLVCATGTIHRYIVKNGSCVKA